MAKNGKMTAERFVEKWQAADSGAEVADFFDVSRQYVHQYAVRLRRAGIPLKRFRRARLSAAEIASLRALAEKHAPRG